MRTFITILVGLFVCQPVLAQAESRPNVLWILADDLGYGEKFKNVDIPRWMPGDQWNIENHRYEVAAAIYRVHGSFLRSPNVSPGPYIVALAILDPAGMLPAVRFAIRNYFIGGRHPICLVGVNTAVKHTDLDSDSFADPAKDRTLHCETIRNGPIR